MFCNQCEQTAHGTGCVLSPGVCGKNEDVQSLQETLLYGLKGMAAYAHHARRLGKTDESVSAFIEEALFATDDERELRHGVAAGDGPGMRPAEPARHGNAGPGARGEVRRSRRPTEVREGTQAGPGILVTGHDMVDLENLLKQCEGTDVKVYTHGEMLPGAHVPEAPRASRIWPATTAAPGRSRSPSSTPSPARSLATTNCVLIPRPTYADRLFTTRCTAVPAASGSPTTISPR